MTPLPLTITLTFLPTATTSQTEIEIPTRKNSAGPYLAGPITITWGSATSWGHDQPGGIDMTILSSYRWEIDVRSGIRVKVASTVAGVTHNLFDGILTTADLLYKPHRSRYKWELRLTGIDAIALLDRTMIGSAPWYCWQLPKDRMASIIDRIATRLGTNYWTAKIADQLTGLAPLAPPWLNLQDCAVRPRDVDNHSALGLLQVTAASAGGRIVAAPQGVMMVPLPTGIPLTTPIIIDPGHVLLGPETSDPHSPTQAGVTSWSGYPQNVPNTSPTAFFRATQLTESRACWTFPNDPRPPVATLLETDVAGFGTQRYWLQPDGTAGAESTFTNSNPEVINSWVSNFLTRCRDKVPAWRRESIEILPVAPTEQIIPLCALGTRSVATIELPNRLAATVTSHAIIGGTLTLSAPMRVSLNLEPLSVATANSNPAWSDSDQATWPPQPSAWTSPQLVNH